MLKRLWNKVPDRPTWRIFNLLLVVLVIAIIGFQAQINGIKTNQKASRDRGFINRAQTCQIHAALGIPLDDDCLDRNVVLLYNPELPPVAGHDSQGQVVNRRIMCGIASNVGVHDEACSEQGGQ